MKAATANIYIQWGLKHHRQLLVILLLIVLGTLIFQQAHDIYIEINHKNSLIKQKDISSNHSSPNSPSITLNDFKLLFGINQRQDIKKVSADIPKTQLNLTLHGALGNLKKEGATKGSAIIQSNNLEKLYQVGERLPGGATLSEVHSNYVVIDRNGQFEKLAFPELSLTASGLKPVPPSRIPSYTSSNADYTQPSGNDSLEDRMRQLKEQLKKAEQ